jgi:hypothetical protein
MITLKMHNIMSNVSIDIIDRLFSNTDQPDNIEKVKYIYPIKSDEK